MFSFLLLKNLHSAKNEVSGTTVGELREALAGCDSKDEVVIYADVVGEWERPQLYGERQAVVCGYYAVADVCVTAGAAVIETGVEASF